MAQDARTLSGEKQILRAVGSSKKSSASCEVNSSGVAMYYFGKGHKLRCKFMYTLSCDLIKMING